MLKHRIVLSLLAIICSVSAWAQQEVRGTVSNKQEPLSGINVRVEGSNVSTATDDKGSYIIRVPSEETVLIFSSIGYVSQQVVVGGQTNIDITLEEDFSELDEVVVVGYGTQKRENLTGAVSTVAGSDLEKRPVMRASAALQGLAPGVTVTQRSGQPGSDGGTIRIRGIGTLGDASPLVLIDGIEGSLDGVDPNDIESVSLLKDASSASIYGSRAANGVVLVTTKMGKGERLNVNYNNFMGWQEFTELPEYADGYTYLLKINEAYANMGRDPLFSDQFVADYVANKDVDPDRFPDVDWQKEVYTGSGALQNHHLSISGGQKVNVMGSLAYQNQKGLIPGYSSERYSFRFNAKMDVLDNLQALVMLSGRSSPTTIAANDNDVIIGVNRTPAIYASRYTDGRWGTGRNGFNPLAQVTEGGFDQTTYNNFRSIFQVNYQPTKNIDIELNYTPEFNMSEGKRFAKAIDTYDVGSQTPTFTVPVLSTLDQSFSKYWDNTLRLLARFSEDFQGHSIQGLVGFEQIDRQANSFGAARRGFDFPDYPHLNAGSVEFMTNRGTANDWALQSYFGRANYSYNDKYLLEANLRIDGSSRFATGYKWGTFPSFSAGWVISNEAFLEDNDWLSFLKARASWGRLGNQLIGNYPFASVITLGENYVNNGQPVNGAAQIDMANELISWETTTSSNIGLDVGFFSKKFNMSFDYYVRNTTDILLELPVSAIIGLDRPYQNAGVVRNAGWDLSLIYNDTYGQFNHRMQVNLSDVHNKVVDVKGVGPIIGTYTFNQEGYPINSLYGYKAVSLFQSQDEIDAAPTHFGIYAPGDIRYEDVNGDGRIGPDDRVGIGSTIPRYTYGFNYAASYKDFDFSFLVQGVGKADVLLARDAAWAFYNSGTIRTWQLDSWTSDNRDASYPRLVAERTHNNFENSSFWVYNASYLRLKNIQLGYTLNSSILSKLSLQRVRLFGTADNLFTSHRMPEGWDPERPNGDATNFPVARTFSFGINVTF